MLGGVAILSVVPRLLDGARQEIDYNSFWHIFIARNLSREWRGLAHPPFYLLLLKAVQVLGHTPLVYRSIGILSGAASVYLFGRILEKLGARTAIVLLGAAAMALASSPISLSLTIESYALCTFFVLGSFFFYLDLLAPGPAPALRPRLAFAFLAALALLTHYYAGLYLGACVAAPFFAGAIRPSYRQAMRRSLSSRWKADALTLASLAGLGLLVYEIFAKFWVGKPKGLPYFYYDKRLETAAHFLVRNFRNTFGLLSPVDVPRARYAIAGLALLFALALLLPAAGRPSDPRRLIPAVFSILLLLGGALLGTLALYPFGGAMRHQYLLYVFALLAGFVALDALLSVLRWKTARAAALAAAAAVLVFSFLRRAPARDPGGPDSFLPALEELFRTFPDTRVVHVDSFDLIGVFSGYHDGEFRFDGWGPGDFRVQRYTVAKGGRRFTLLAHRNWWFFWFGDARVYRDLAPSWSTSGCEAVFGANRSRSAAAQRSFAERSPEERTAAIRRLASAHGLEARRVVFDGLDTFAELCAENLRVSRIEPAETRAGAGFQLQPSGRSAMSILGGGFEAGAVASIGGTKVETTFGNRGWLTVLVPEALYAKPGALEVRVENPGGAVSNAVTFEVRP